MRCEKEGAGPGPPAPAAPSAPRVRLLRLDNETTVSTEEGRHEERGENQLHWLTPHRRSPETGESGEEVAEGRPCE